MTMRTYTEAEMIAAQRRAFLDGCAATAYIVYPSDAADVELLATVTYEQNIDGGHWSDDEVRERAEVAAARRYPTPAPETCASTTGGGRYRSDLAAGHAGEHHAAGTFTYWGNPAPALEAH